jgi:hypothetical protein
MKTILLLTALFWLSTFNTIATAQEIQDLHKGELNGAPYKIAVPHNAAGQVFFHVHGWRPADAPHEADLDLSDPFYMHLLEEGWIIGRTAFLENGVDHDAHTQSLYDLKDYIASEIGEIERLILEGESTAGTLVLRIAERNPSLADGVIAKGAFIDLNDPAADAYLTGKPEIPAILMSNLTELDGPVAYAAVSEHAPVPPMLRPLLRPGHVNVNWIERRDALTDLSNAIEQGTYTPFHDGTRKVPERETGTEFSGSAIINNITAVDPFFGNATAGFHPDELKQAGITRGSTFIMEVHGQQRNIFYGDSYGDVAHGEWVAFPLADDQILIARNHESAISTANILEGDRIKFIPIESEN